VSQHDIRHEVVVMHLRLLDSSTTTKHGRYASSSAHLRRAPAAQRPVEQPAAAVASSVRFWRPLPRTEVDVICGEWAVLEVPRQAHEALQVLLPTTWVEVVDGSGRQPRLVGPGSIHLTSPLELHAIRGVGGGPVGLRVLLVAPTALAKLWRELGASVGTTTFRSAHRIVDDLELYRELSELFDDFRRPVVALDKATRLVECLARLFGEHDRDATAEPKRAGCRISGIERARDHLRAHVPDAISLDELAAVAGLSKYYLLRAFRNAFGLTPHAYQMQLRLARARRLIADGHALSYVTYEAGFADQSHLTRRFAGFLGLTPARFARQLCSAESHGPDATSAAHQVATPPHGRVRLAP
jgi:AraC-like DNA-binding protein